MGFGKELIKNVSYKFSYFKDKETAYVELNDNTNYVRRFKKVENDSVYFYDKDENVNIKEIKRIVPISQYIEEY